MVLAKLAAYERRFSASADEPRPTGYKPRPVRWIVELHSNGDPEGGSLALALTSQSGGKRRGRSRDPGKVMLVPGVRRSAETKPALLADNGEYVFGLVRKKDDPARAKRRHNALLRLLEDCAAETGLPEVQAVVTFLSGLEPNALEQLPSDFDPDDTIAFRVEGEIVSGLPEVRGFWQRRFEQATQTSARMRRSASRDSAEAPGLISQCLVCGQTRPIAATHPVPIEGVPGGNATLVSFNADAFASYGLGQSYNAPACVDCAQDYARGLNRLLADEETHLRLGNVVYAFWTREPTTSLPLIQRMFSGPRAEEVRDLMTAAFKGGAAATRPDALRDRTNAFYAAGFASHQGRVVMLSWLETTVEAAVENLARYFLLQTIPPRYPTQQPFFSVYQLVASLLQKGRRRGGEPAELDARALSEIVHMALGGGPLADWLLFQAVRRNRASQDVPPARAALIRLVLASQEPYYKGGGETLPITTEQSPAFLCGRLLAVLEWAQREAIGDPNTTLVDRFYGSASAAPCSVFGTLLRNAQPHLGKLRRERRGLYVTIQRQLEDILSGLGPSFPQVLALKDQATFALGYYYQRASRGENPHTSGSDGPKDPAPGTGPSL